MMANPCNRHTIVFFYTVLSITTTNTFSFITTPSFGSSQNHHTSTETGGGVILRQFHSPQRSPLSSSSLLLSSSPSSLTPPPTEQQDDDDTSWRKCITEPSPPISTPLNDAVSLIANVSLSKANELIDIGAVWAKMDLLTDGDLLEQYYDNSDESSSLSYYADLPKGWSGNSVDDDDADDDDEYDGNDYNAAIDIDYVDDIMRRNTRFRRILTPVIIPPHTPLRIYPHPRRFPSCSQLSSPPSSSSTKNPRLLYEDTTFVVVDKPPMLPTQPDASNYYECCPGCVNDYMGPFHTIDGELVRRPLICHRVDSCVGGVVVLSKDEKGQRVFSEFQRDRKIKKLYLAVTRQPVPLGLHTHWLFKASTARGSTSGPPCQLLSHETPPSRKSRKAWIRCLLEVTSCTPITIPPNPSIYTPPSSSTNNNNNNEIKHYQSTIRLVTGRKHQIRAQLSSLGCPIINDSLYEPIAGMTLDQISYGDDVEDAEERLDRAVSQCRVPKKPIGLQAAGILFGGIRVRAGPPWWHG